MEYCLQTFLLRSHLHINAAQFYFIDMVLKTGPARPVEPENSGTGDQSGPEDVQPDRESYRNIPGLTLQVEPGPVCRNRDPDSF